MAYDSVPFLESVLFQSPYSGCRRFSGWTLGQGAIVHPPGTTAPSPYNASGAILCADRYQKRRQVSGTPASPHYGPARATFTSSIPTQAGRFTVVGPSSKGPFTYGQQGGICWGGDTDWPTSSGSGSGHNLGLG
jgi:hypothetical protein